MGPRQQPTEQRKVDAKKIAELQRRLDFLFVVIKNSINFQPDWSTVGTAFRMSEEAAEKQLKDWRKGFRQSRVEAAKQNDQGGLGDLDDTKWTAKVAAKPKQMQKKAKSESGGDSDSDSDSDSEFEQPTKSAAKTKARIRKPAQKRQAAKSKKDPEEVSAAAVDPEEDQVARELEASMDPNEAW